MPPASQDSATVTLKRHEMNADDYDVFLSYNGDDEAAVEGLARRLRDEGLRVFFAPWHLVPGVPWLKGLEEALKRSQSCAIFLGPAGRGPWQDEEMFMALLLAVPERGYRVIPVLLPGADPADANTVPLFLRSRTWVDFRPGLEDRAALHRLRCGVLGIKPGDVGGVVDIDPDAIPSVHPLPPGSVMSISPNPHFTGREEELRKLARLLDAEGRVAAIGQVAAATGLGGIGKTQLAAEYAHRYGARYPGGVFWLNMEDPEAIAAQVAACGGPGGLNLSPFPDKLPEQVACVRQEWQKRLPRLLIFDNADTPQVVADWRPTTGGCRVLITSRRQDWSALPAVQCLPLDTLPRPDSRRLLLRRRAAKLGMAAETLLEDPQVKAAAEAVCDLLGDLPLALHLAGAYLADPHATTLPGYLEELRAQPVLEHAALVDWVQDPSPTQHIQNVAATFEMSVACLDPNDPRDALARRLFELAGHFAPGVPVDRELLTALEKKREEQDLRKSLRRVFRRRPQRVEPRFTADALYRLESLGLVTRDADGSVRLHRLLAEFVRGHADDQYKDFAAVADAVTYVTRSINQSGLPNLMRPPLLEHVRYLAGRAEAEDIKRAGHLFNELGLHLKNVADLTGARAAYERVLRIDKVIFGPNHPNVVTDAGNLGGVLCDLGDLSGARQIYEWALPILERALGSMHPNVAGLVNNLGLLLRDMGDLVGARDSFVRVLRILGKTLPPSDPRVASTWNNLGLVLYDLGDLAGAWSAHERALRIWKSTLGPYHPQVATSLNNSGLVLHDLGNLAGARAAYEQALQIWENTLGPYHPQVASCLSNLGSVLHDLKDLSGAQAAHERALRIFETALGPDHPSVAEAINNLGGVLYAQGDLVGARAAYERALAIDEVVFGPDHPKVANRINNLGTVLPAQGDLAGARQAFERALRIFEKSLGPDHPKTQRVRRNLEGLS